MKGGRLLRTSRRASRRAVDLRSLDSISRAEGWAEGWNASGVTKSFTTFTEPKVTTAISMRFIAMAFWTNWRM
ncbi:hypothetical protein FG93_05154 [Bosea sp. LC85]|nr:hypothetical protein FG93_05154 [Bosea sp. LC85]